MSKCKFCGKPIELKQWEIDEKMKVSKRTFCNKSCASKYNRKIVNKGSSWFVGEDKPTEYQKKAWKGLFSRKPKRKSIDRYAHNRNKYWCPKYPDDWYTATSRHTVCKLCGDKHEIIKYEEREI